MNERFLATAAVALALGAAFGSGTGSGEVDAGDPVRSAVEALPVRHSPEPAAAGGDTKQASGAATEWFPTGLIPNTDFLAAAVAAVGARSRLGDGSRAAGVAIRPRIEKSASRGYQAMPVDPPLPTPEP